MKRKVILVTDGDIIARQAVEIAAANIGGRCISASAGNPTPLSGEQVVNLIMQAKYDPVVVMVDDKGSCHKGKGERVLEYVAKHPAIEVMGVLAVASNTEQIEGAEVDCSITKRKELIQGEVDKSGEMVSHENIVKGDTVDVINALKDEEVPFVVGVGDIGKMDGKDKSAKGAEVTTKALQTILAKWEERGGGKPK